MPILQRRQLRQQLGTEYLRDTYVSKTTGSCGVAAGAVVWDTRLCDAALVEDDLYQRAILRVLTASAYVQDLRVHSFNTGSGAFVSLTVHGTTIISGADFEVHQLLPPAEKDLAIDAALKRMRVASWSSIDAVVTSAAYSLAQSVIDVLEVAINPYPAGSVIGYLPKWWRFVKDPNGNSLWVDTALPASSQLAFRAVTVPTLGSADTATVFLPAEDWVLSGAAAQAYWLLSRRGPAQEVAAYRESHRELTNTFVRLSERFRPDAPRKIQLQALW